MGRNNSVQDNLLLSVNNIPVQSGTVHDLSAAQNAEKVMALEEGTILVSYDNTFTGQFQSLFSVANATAGNNDRHFHLYITPTGVLGFELRNTDGVFKYTLSRPAAVRLLYKGKLARNTVALVANRAAGTYTLFANGTWLDTLTQPDFKFFSDITGVNTVSLGGTIRGGAVAYPFGGTIYSASVYGAPLSDQDLLRITAETAYGSKPFYAGDATGSNYFRIPSLLTLQSGRLAAAIDARYGGTHDSKSKIDTGFALSNDGGATWQPPTLPYVFEDYAAQTIDWPRAAGDRDLQISGSASFIDPSMVQDKESGRLYLFIDVMPAGVGSSNAVVGSGFAEVDGQKYLKLRWHEDATNAYNYTLRDGVIYDNSTNQPTEYTVNENFEIAQNGTPLQVNQYAVRFANHQLLEEATDTKVNMSVFYKDALFKVLPTAYLAVKHSDDEGETWSPMTLLNYLKDDAEKLLITCPGVGIQVGNGPKAGRLVVPVYTVTTPGFSVLTSDDGGASWQLRRGAPGGSGSTAEAQAVEMPDGSLKMIERTNLGHAVISTSVDSGDTWVDRTALNQVPATSYGTQISAMNYSAPVDGKPAILLAAPLSTGGRRGGHILTGLITDTGAEGAARYSIDWAYDFAIDGPQIGYSYSCLAELPGGEIGLFYEKYDSWSRDELHLMDIMVYESYNINEIKVSGT